MSRAPAEREKLEALASMDLTKILRAYVMAVVDAAQGYKALMVDKDTMRIASTLCGRSELSDHGIVLIERLDASKGKDHQELKVRMARFNPSASGGAAGAARLMSWAHGTSVKG